MTLIDNAIYVDGVRTQSPETLDETYELLHERHGMAWIGLVQPSEEELRSVADEFSLHPLAVEDALKGHQRAKLERYGSTLFVVLRPAWYLDAEEEVVFGEVHVFVGPEFVVTVRHAERPDLAQVRRRLEAAPELLALGPESVLYAILDEVADGYAPVVAGLENDIDEIEDQLFRRDPEVSLRIYELLREVIGFQRAVNPLKGMLDALVRGADKYEVDVELQRSLRDVADHVLRVTERVDSFRVLLGQCAHRACHARHAGSERRDAAPLADRHRPERRRQEDLIVGGDPVRANPHRLDLRDELRPHAGTSIGSLATPSRSRAWPR